MLEKCASCKPSVVIDQLVVEKSLEDGDTNDSRKSDSSCDSEDSKSESDTTEVEFYRWQTVEKKITTSRIEVTFKDAIEMLKEEAAILKAHIHIKRRQVNAYQEMKASLNQNNLMIQVDFAESYRNEQQDAIESAYFGNQCFSIFTVSCYFNVQGKKTDTVIVVTDRSDHDRVTSMSFLQKVVHKIESKHTKCHENLVVWSDGMGAQFRSRFVFQILAGTVLPSKFLMWLYNEHYHGKGLMDGVG